MFRITCLMCSTLKMNQEDLVTVSMLKHVRHISILKIKQVFVEKTIRSILMTIIATYVYKYNYCVQKLKKLW